MSTPKRLHYLVKSEYPLYMNIVNSFSDSILQYRSRIKRKREFFDYAKSTSSHEILKNLQNLKGEGSIIDPLLTLTKSSLWVGRSGLHYFKSFLDVRAFENLNLKKPRAQEIICGVTNDRTVDDFDEEVFSVIYNEIIY